VDNVIDKVIPIFIGKSYIQYSKEAMLEMPLSAQVYLRKKIHISGKSYYYIHIPAKVGSDSQFPFKEGDKLQMVIDPSKKKIILTKVTDKRKVKVRST